MRSLLVLIVLSLGCSYVPTTRMRYAPAGPKFDRPPVDITVLPLEDERPPRHMPSLQGNLFKTYIPLLPYVKIPYERIDEHYILGEEEAGVSESTVEPFTEAFADAMAADLRKSHVAKRVLRAATPEAAAPGSLRLGGTLESTEFDYYATSYMLGLPGVLLWFLPIPNGANAATVEINLELRDPEGQVLWEHFIDGREYRIFTLYNSGGAPISSRYRLEIKRFGGNDEGIDGDSVWAYHAAALRKAMEPAKRSLVEYLRSYAARQASR